MYRLRPNDVLVNGYPIFHVAGSFCYGLSVLSAGAALLIPTRLGMRTKQFISKIWKHVEQYRITVIGGVPTVVSALNMVPIDADISTLRLVISGGSPLPTELADALERLVGKPLLRNLFGMTECAGVVTLEPFSDARSPGSAGFRLPFTEVRAFRDVGGKVDLDAPCDVDETGVLALRGPHVAPGYTEEKMNAGTFERGWLISGDLGHVGTNERVYVTGRAKDVIIRGAHNIDPSMIEDAMLQHPDVAVAGAVGQPDSYAGEIPVVFVSLKPGSTVTEDQLREFVGPLVAEPAAQPKHVWILPELPMTPIGKIYKPTLREIATKRAMADSLLRAGVPPSLFEIEMHQRKGVVRLKSKDRKHTAQAQQALLGMPVEYEIQEIPKAESVK
jgi:fatty-acyl-CoA synthase